MDLEAIVLYQVDYRDSSKILYLYSKQGHHNVLAHGVKKMNSTTRFLSQIGNVISLSIPLNKELPAMKDGELVADFPAIISDVIAYSYLTHILELVRHTVSADLDHVKMYRFLRKILDRLNEGTDPETLTFLFELKLLYFLGHGLHLTGCTMCDERDDLVFHISSGGLVCRHHLHPTDTMYDTGVYTQLMTLYYLDLDKTDIPAIDANDRVILRHIIDLLYSEFVGYQSKSRSILKQLKKY